MRSMVEGVSESECALLFRPFHRATRGPPPPRRGGGNEDRSRGAFFASEFCQSPRCTNFVTTGLDPVVHADLRLCKALRQTRSGFPSAWIAGHFT